ncbi:MULTISPECIES: DUF1365 domain-containing protein [Halomonadaceae]|uniref:DUF1365 domain-containing protein n=1 Tax=Vreelandella janggokensis TaxID=370767 RepID=A0ABT4IWT0_9GAMM|nr:MULTISPECIES: DUF1365 domain-containing protein [Halomonas]MCW4151291.1 DUF1365 domain-containing protein [Halomonas sp. 18H]MCZ0928123.1 DUF1365 domain-containing protein [Halomonas janggokensis]MDR5887210.1 DUF1365 domain-containing protein [Halomonas janggokensis]
MITTPHSRVYRGTLRHRRFSPHAHRFDYQLWMAWLDLDELPTLFDGVPGFSARGAALARFRREDYLGPTDRPLATAVREELTRQLGSAPEGRICVLTQLRTLGAMFNPISMYYAYDRQGQLSAVLGEVTNMPWRERTCYACRVDSHRHSHHATFAKAMHVSPFNPMDMTYRWRFNTPGDQLLLHMENWQAGQRHFDATLTLEAAPATARVLLTTLARQPWISLKTITGIHFEALRLWLKRNPVYNHPKRKETSK